MQKNASPKYYFLLVFALTVPFWLFGGGKLPLPINLPVSALATFIPAIAASILSYQREGVNGIKALLMRAFDYQRIKDKKWYLPALFLQPLIYFLAFLIMRLAGLPLPDPVEFPLLLAPVFFVMFFIGDAGEELGWTGYAIDPMQNRWGALRAALLLGVIWAVWHAIPYIQTRNPVNWIVWQSLLAIEIRVLIVWIYNNAGKSVFAAILFHVMTNMSWTFFPNFGSHFNPFITFLITSLILAMIIWIWKSDLLRPSSRQPSPGFSVE